MTCVRGRGRRSIVAMLCPPFVCVFGGAVQDAGSVGTIEEIQDAMSGGIGEILKLGGA